MPFGREVRILRGTPGGDASAEWCTIPGMTKLPGVEDVLAFWFGALDAQGHADAEHSARWFRKDPAFDRTCQDSFAPLHRAVASGECDGWLATAPGRLAFIVVLDQFSRNMFRDTGETFAHDPRALAVAREGIARGDDRTLPFDQRSFFYMPFMHAEDLPSQEQGVALFSRWRDELTGPDRTRVEGLLRYAEQHRDIVRRFGRFPHRNRLLGRESTAEETAFLAGPGSSF